MNILIDAITKISPVLGTMLGGPAGGLVGTLISRTLGGIDMSDPAKVVQAIKSDPDAERKIRELDIQLNDLQHARIEASKEVGAMKIVRPLLAIAAMIAIFINIVLIKYVVEDEIVRDVLIVMMVFLVWDIRQIYKFYFGNEEEVPGFLFSKLKK